MALRTTMLGTALLLPTPTRPRHVTQRTASTLCFCAHTTVFVSIDQSHDTMTSSQPIGKRKRRSTNSPIPSLSIRRTNVLFLNPSTRISQYLPIPAQASSSTLKSLAKDPDVWRLSKTICLSVGLDPRNRDHNSAIWIGCQGFYFDKLRMYITKYKKTNQARRYLCEQPWDCTDTIKECKVHARDWFLFLFAASGLEGGGSQAKNQRALTPPPSSRGLTGACVTTDTNKTKRGGCSVIYLDDKNRITPYSISRILESMGEHTMLEEHELEMLKCLQNIHVAKIPTESPEPAPPKTP